MTLTANEDITSTRGRAARRRLAGLAIAGLASLGVLANPAGSVDAARRTKSEALADQADTALDALDRWNESQNPFDYIRFVQARDDTATTAEAEMELLPGALQQAWSGVAISNQQALLSAVSQLGVPYRSIASEPGVGFDCSGLTIWAYAQAGVDVPRVSGDQIRAAAAVGRETAEAGDLVYYPGHISMYIGADLMVHSPNTGSHVEIVHLPTTKTLRFGDTTPADVTAEVTAVTEPEVESPELGDAAR
ncbi:MAG: NlpC/P60 family protein [Ilumatobacteraceae bacterium]